jgi:tetratricopeptide (TPR) repeat protein
MPSNDPSLEEFLSQARMLERKGDFARAEGIYRDILEKWPDDPRARRRLKALGALTGAGAGLAADKPRQSQIDEVVALYNQGRLPEALAYVSALVDRFPNAAQLHNIQGAVNARLGRFPETLACYQKALALKPEYAEVHNNLANTLARLGRHEEAIASYGEALKLKPDYAEAHNNMGSARHQLGRYEEAIACYRQALKIAPAYAEAHNNLGNALSDLDRPDEARACFSRALELNPGLAEAHNNLGNAFRKLGKIQSAMESFADATRVNSEYADAWNNLGTSLNELGRSDQALECFARAVKLRPGFAAAHANLGNTLSDLGRHPEAIACYQAAIHFQPGFAQWHNNLGNALYDLGRFDDAEASYTRALELDPGFAQAHYNLGLVATCSAGDPRLDRMLALRAQSDISEQDAMFLDFALGKACEELGDMDKAFSYLSQGNRLKKKAIGYEISADRARFSQIREMFWMDGLRGLRPAEAPTGEGKQPIFIVGMPRSGTTLVEQILASHPRVHGGGERQALTRILNPVLDKMASENNALLDPRLIAQVWNAYLEPLQRNPAEAAYITDKMPGNFMWIGFLLSANPDVKIIHVRRDPVATCWSIFKHQFGDSGNGYAYDQLDVAEYYNLYADLMDYWNKAFPGRIFELNYESLTENQEQETRRLLDYCGLDWDPACLDFHKTTRAVQTLSGQQVRRSMYTGSSQAWRKVEAQLQPMIGVLGARS